MKVTIGENDRIPQGEYLLMGLDKLLRAQQNFPSGTKRQILLEYDKLGGRVTKDGNVLPPQSLWKIEQNYMNKPIEEFSDTELLAVIRRAESTNVPGSLYQRADKEYQIRHQEKLLNFTGQNKSGIFFEVGGNMVNHGVIQTAKDAVVNVAVAGNYSSNKNTKIIQGDMPLVVKKWYEKPFGIVLLSVIGGVIIGGLIYLFGWN